MITETIGWIELVRLAVSVVALGFAVANARHSERTVRRVVTAIRQGWMPAYATRVSGELARTDRLFFVLAAFLTVVSVYGLTIEPTQTTASAILNGAYTLVTAYLGVHIAQRWWGWRQLDREAAAADAGEHD